LDLIFLIILALALGTDAFSLCVGLGLAGVNFRQSIALSLTILFFHIFMPLAGWQIGEIVGNYLGRLASLAGALILIYLGVHLIWATRHKTNQEISTRLLNSGWGYFLLGLSVSMDALSAGFSLGTQKISLFWTVTVIGLVAGLMTLGGLVGGRYFSRLAGRRAQMCGGLVLIGVGVKLFF
jgi:putative Mn2+ efflux pump MntP